MGSQIRRKPHALNLLWQMKLLARMRREESGGFEAGLAGLVKSLARLGRKPQR